MLVGGIFQQKPLAFIESLWGWYKETYIKRHFKIPGTCILFVVLKDLRNEVLDKKLKCVHLLNHRCRNCDIVYTLPQDALKRLR